MKFKYLLHSLIPLFIMTDLSNFAFLNQSLQLEQNYQAMQAWENQIMQSQTPPDRGLPRRRESGSTGFRTVTFSHIG